MRALASDGVSQRQIAKRLGIHRRTVARALASETPPRYVRAPAGSQLDPLMPVISQVLSEWPEIKAPRLAELLRDEHGYRGSVDLVRRKLQTLRPREERAAQRTGYRPGQVVQFDWGEMSTRPRVVRWNQRFLHLRGHYAFHSTACTPATPREKGSVEGAVRYLKTGFWPARRFQTLGELDSVYADWRDRVAHQRRHATSRFIVAERLAEERSALRSLPPGAFDFSLNRTVRVPTDGYLRHGA